MRKNPPKRDALHIRGSDDLASVSGMPEDHVRFSADTARNSGNVMEAVSIGESPLIPLHFMLLKLTVCGIKEINYYILHGRVTSVVTYELHHTRENRL